VHFSDGEVALSSSSGKYSIPASENILLKCGNHFADFIQNKTQRTIEVLTVHFYPDMLKEMYKDEIPPSFKTRYEKRSSTTIKNSSIINNFVDSLNFYFNNPGIVTTDLIILKVKELILLLLQTSSTKSVSDLFTDLFTPRQAGLKTVIQDHLFSNLSMPELSSLAGMSLSSFKREFKKIYQDTPANYIKTKRILEAEKLLAHSEFTVSEICTQLGFSDTSNFIKTFKSRRGLSPGRFRNRS
jgi:AraC-like DNA-binding protein